MNDQEAPRFSVQPGKTYFLRIINMAGFSQFYIHIDDHDFTIIEADGVYTRPQQTQDLYIATGQRYGVLLKTRPTADKNYPILGALDVGGFDPKAIPTDLMPNVTGALVYDGMFDAHKPGQHLLTQSPSSYETDSLRSAACLRVQRL
jgi:iron transport multicopper oxidase